MMNELNKIIEDFDVVSFDVFDTLVFRSYLTQDDLWMDVEELRVEELRVEELRVERLRSLEVEELRGSSGGLRAKGFLKARVKADRKTYEAATKRSGEHTIEEAYRIMPRRYRPLKAVEEARQRECLAANPEMQAVWKRAGELGKKRIIVSDMYLSEEWFKETLQKFGFGDYDALYVSSERQARKSTGKLFEIVKKDFPAAKILHIGDSRHSDVEMAERAGISAYHYRNLREEAFEKCPFLKAFMEYFPSFEKQLLVGALVRGWKLAGGADKDYWYRLGYFFGGVLGHLYVTWLAERAKANGIDHLMFVARDGYLWKQMFDSLGTGIKTDYFYAPRMTSVKVCGVIGTDPKAMAERQRILDLLPDNDPAAELARYREYLARFDVGERTAIVDGVSSAFSVQRLVAAAVGRSVKTFYLVSFSPLDNGEAMLRRKNSFSWHMLSEFLFSSSECPIDDVDSQGPVYRKKIAGEEAFRKSVFASVADGAMAGFAVLKDFAVEARFDRQYWLDYVNVFRLAMTEEDERMLAKAQNAWKISQDNFSPILKRAEWNGERVTRRFGLVIGLWRTRETTERCEQYFYLRGRWLICKRVVSLLAEELRPEGGRRS